MHDGSPDSLTITAIRDVDIPAVIALWHRAGVSRPWNDPERDIAFARQSPHATVLIGTIEGVVVATAMVGEDGHRGWVYYVGTDPDRQRGGLGRAIMAAAEHWLRERGVWKLQLMVRRDNSAAAGFYTTLGFREVETVTYQKVIG